MEDHNRVTDTRRGVLKKMGAGAFLPLGGFASQSEEMVKLPELRNNEGVVKWIEVPKAWADHKRQAEKVSNELQKEYAGAEGVVEVGLVAASERYGGKRGLEVEVGVDSDVITAEITDHTNGIPVQTVQRKQATVDLCYNHSYDDLPGGVQIGNQASGTVSVGTTAWKVEHSGEMMMLTARHVIPSTQDVYGDQSGSSLQKVGEVDSRDSDTDMAAVESSRSIPNQIQGDGSTYDIGGWVTESGISNRVTSPIDGYRKMGSTTGETTGGLGKYHIGANYDSDVDPSYDGHGVRGSADAASGDSGGPAFSLHNGDAYVISLVTQGDPKAGQRNSNSNCRNINPYKKSIGTAAYRLNNNGYQAQGSSHS
ncbi:hypothetical protein ACFQE1_01630 [Halobium palmae]|uniref:Peptidase S1 domain-containing protein n=1 Tax=Halobium palmae TaxID=1776492 RepID=A0ABD5RUR9_9EURY